MKITSLFFILFMISFLSFGCSNDDDNKSPSIDNHQKIIGKWYFEESPTLPPFNECDKMGFLEFDENTVRMKLFLENSDGNCILFGEDTTTYEMVSETKIKIIPSDDPAYEITIITVDDNTLILDDFVYLDGNKYRFVFRKG